MNLTQIRKHVRDNYLNNQVISGAEAKDLIQTVAGDGLSIATRTRLEKIRAEFKDQFSEAGLREFDKLLAKASAHLPAPGGGSSAVDVLTGRALPPTKTVTLSQVADADVRKALRQLDFNTDGKVDDKDRQKMGFSDEQWRSFLFMAALMGQKIDAADAAIPADLTGKTVAFTAVPDKAKAARWAERMGATVAGDIGPNVDFLIVGSHASTGKDERAAAMNVLGEADIKLADYATFARQAHAQGATGAAPDPITGAQLTAKISEMVDAWHYGHIDAHYAHEYVEATTDVERARVQADRQTDLAGDKEWQKVSLDDATWYESVEDGDYTDGLGRPIARADLVEVAVSFFPEYAGIGLGVYLLVDKRTGELIDESDIVD